MWIVASVRHCAGIGRATLAVLDSISTYRRFSSLWRDIPAVAGLSAHKEKPPPVYRRGFWVKTLAMTYSRMLDAHYHRRMYVSLPSSEWDRVVPYSYCHQGEGGGSQVVPVIDGLIQSKVGLTALTLSSGWEVANILDDSFVSLAKDASFEAT